MFAIYYDLYYDLAIDSYPYTLYTSDMTGEELTTKEVANILNCSVMTVTELVKRGHFPGARKMDPTRRNSPLRIPREDVDAYKKKQLVSPKHEI